MIRTLSVASEAFPLIKTGGLADVVGALPAALAPHGVEATTLLPAYPAVAEVARDAREIHRFELYGSQARLLATHLGDYTLLLLDAPDLYARLGGPYADENGRDWPDNWRRFAALALTGAVLAAGLVEGFRFDILHAHDWQAGLAPAYLRTLSGELASPTPLGGAG